MQHLEEGWNIFSHDLGHYLKIAPPQMMTGEKWYQGTADSIRQNVYLIEQENPGNILILSGDHVCKMDYTLLRAYHEKHNADVTVSVIEARKELSKEYGVLEVDNDFRVTGFQEKPRNPRTIPSDSSRILASMGIYIFKAEILLYLLKKDERPDFGHDILPDILDRFKVMAYPYKRQNRIADRILTTDEEGNRSEIFEERARDSGYWRDVGTLDAYWNANMDLTGVDPYFNMYGRMWPLRTNQRQFPPVKTVFAQNNSEYPRMGMSLDSLVAHGSILSGGTVRNSVLSYNVLVQSWASVEESVIMENVVIGRYAKIKKAIISEGVRIPHHMEIGFDPMKDRERFTVTPRGITVVTKEDIH